MPLYKASMMQNDMFRADSTQRAIAIIKALDFRIENEQHVELLGGTKGIGERTKKKVVEILRTSSLRKVDYMKRDPTRAAREDLK